MNNNNNSYIDIKVNAVKNSQGWKWAMAYGCPCLTPIPTK